VALIEWLEVTFWNVYEVIDPFDTPSTFTSAIWKYVFGFMVKVLLAPGITVRVPFGEIEPLLPADAGERTKFGVRA